MRTSLPCPFWRPAAVLGALLLALGGALPVGAQSADTLRAEGAGSCEDPFADARPLNFDPQGWATNFCRHSVPYDEIQSGGPPRDGIPPIDAPRFVSVEAADLWLGAQEPVILLRHGGEARAYPLQVLIWHEIVNDQIGGAPVAVTFCPLCYAAIAFARPTVDGEALTFGTTGNLRKSDLVMWDRQTESWWQQFTGEAIAGRLTGQQLDLLPASIIAWETFRARYPQGAVLSRETGFDRPYGRNPYAGYDDVEKTPLMYNGPVGEALPPMARVVGVEQGGAGRAYALEALREARAVNDTLAGTPLAVLWQPGTASAVSRPQVAGGADAGTTGVFRTTHEGRRLTFRPAEEDGRFTDAETGSTWTVLGEAVAGPLEGATLTPLVHHDIFWFVWSAFQPEGGLYAPS